MAFVHTISSNTAWYRLQILKSASTSHVILKLLLIIEYISISFSVPSRCVDVSLKAGKLPARSELDIS